MTLQSPPLVPTIGRIVLYTDTHGITHTAIIIDVRGQQHDVSVHVFLRDGSQRQRFNAPFSPTPGGQENAGCWSWPPRTHDTVKAP